MSNLGTVIIRCVIYYFLSSLKSFFILFILFGNFKPNESLKHRWRIAVPMMSTHTEIFLDQFQLSTHRWNDFDLIYSSKNLWIFFTSLPIRLSQNWKKDCKLKSKPPHFAYESHDLPSISLFRVGILCFAGLLYCFCCASCYIFFLLLLIFGVVYWCRLFKYRA